MKKAYIDNKAYEINKGETMLEFVRRVKGHDSIPTMCQADNLENFGSCRVCSVDVALQKDGNAKSMASC
ncbi:MAG: 2Fe-2S iron-sulfur cluster binding domain-containing protein, partial [Flavobacteriales bacterium]|nr:2Fe-2S iron-sulfur cluster binding domain-containing protein [Flavobacteriales bacterium]